MRTIDSGLLAALDNDRVINARITIRDTLLRFDEVAIDDGTVDDATFYRADTWTSGTQHILRLALVGNIIYHQYGTSFSSLGSWTQSGIEVKSGSSVGLWQTRMFYQDTSGNMQYRDWGGSSWGSPTQVTPTGWQTSLKAAFAPVSSTEVYYMQEEYNQNADLQNIYNSTIGLFVTTGPTTYQRRGRWYDSTSTLKHFHAVRSQNVLDHDRDIITLATNGGKKAVYMYREGWNYSAVQPIMPLDIIDDTSKLIVGGLWNAGNKVWMTARLVRANGVDLQVYSIIYQQQDMENHMTLGREMFICEHSGPQDDIGMRMHWDGTYVWALGLNHRWRSTGSTYLGTDLAARKLVIGSDITRWSMNCGHNRPTGLSIELDPAVDDPLIAIGNQVELSVAYDNNWSDIGTFIIDQVSRERDIKGQELSLRCMDEVGWRLETFSMDADYDYWGPAKHNIYAKDMAKVLRGQGTWEEVDTNGLENQKLVPKLQTNANSIPSLLLSVDRPSANGSVIAKFIPAVDATGLVHQEYGLVCNVYNEHKSEAEERGSLLYTHFNVYGLYGFALLYGETCAGGSKGLGLYKFDADNNYDEFQEVSMTSLASFAVDLSATTDPVWLWMTFTDGFISVHYRKEPSANWTEAFQYNYTYGLSYPYHLMKDRGNMGVWIANPSEYLRLGPFKSDSLYIPYRLFSGGTAPTAVPTSETLSVDDEHLSYDGKDGNTNAVNLFSNYYAPDMFTFPEADGYQHDNPYTGPFTGYEIYFTSDDTGTQAHDYYNDMAMVVIDGAGKGEVYKITDYDYVAPKQWIPTGTYTYPDTWKDHVGEAGYGSWQTISGLRRIFVNEEPSVMLGETSKFHIYHRLDIDTRALNDTLAANHDTLWGMFYRSSRPSVEDLLMHGGEKDLTFEYLAKDIAAKAGVLSTSFDTIYDEGTLTSFNHSGQWDLSTDHAAHWQPQPEAVIEMYVQSVTNRIGIVLSDSTWPSAGYGVFVDDTYVRAYQFDSSGSPTLYGSIEHYRYMDHNSKVTFVVNQNFMSVYVADHLIAAFPIVETREGIFLAANYTASAYIRWSHLDIHTDNFICDMGSSGISNIDKLIGEKHINFQHDENVLHFFKDRVEINNGDPWVMAITGSDIDDHGDLITRLRLEGVDIHEAIHTENLKKYGNMFGVAHSEEINEAEELAGEAAYIIDDLNSSAMVTELTGAADPRVEPDDILEVTFTGSNRTATREVIVDSVSFDMSIDNDEAEFDMTIEGRDA